MEQFPTQPQGRRGRIPPQPPTAVGMMELPEPRRWRRWLTSLVAVCRCAAMIAKGLVEFAKESVKELMRGILKR